MHRSPDPPTLVVYLDRYHLGDPLFLQRFAPVVRAHEGPLVLIHGSGEAAERALEAEGLFVAREGGALRVEGERERVLVERATRELNRRIVAALTDAGLAAVRLAGTDRGLLKRAPGGALAAGSAGWLRALAGQGVVAVMAALVEGEGGVEEAAPGAAVAALAHALSDGEAPWAVFFVGGGARSGTGGASPEAASSEPEAVRAVVAEGVRVRLARPEALRGAGLPAGADAPGAAVE